MLNIRLYGKVLITGGAGFLGRAIMRRTQLEGWDCKFTVYSRDEQKHVQAKELGYDANYVMGDVYDRDLLERTVDGYDTVIHAAAIKYIPECEQQVTAAIQANVVGTANVLKAGLGSVGTVVVISSDKAAHPINIYGMTKALGEGLVREHASRPFSMSAVACRYGNVIGSTGSIWPVAKAQIKKLGYISITNPAMTRFFMSVDEAVMLIVASAGAPSGSVVIPRPKAMQLGVLADALTKEFHAGEYKVVGARPGEKLHESMLSPIEHDRVVLFDTYYRLLPVGKGPYSNIPRMTSDNPEVTITGDEFITAAYDAERV